MEKFKKVNADQIIIDNVKKVQNLAPKFFGLCVAVWFLQIFPKIEYKLASFIANINKFNKFGIVL